MSKLQKIALLIILLVALAIRIYKITLVPPSLNWDETSIGYNAYSILKTGKDEWGEFMPLHFKSFGEYKLPAQIYASIPAIYLFGLNDFSVRITPVIYGLLTVLLLFLVVNQLFKNINVSLISSALLALSPWHVQLTRGSFESSLSLFWFLLGVLLLLKGFKNYKLILFSMIPFAIAVYTYNTARIFVPMFLFVYYLLNIKFFIRNIKYFVSSTLIFIALMTPLIPFVLSGEASARYKLVSITDDAGLIPRIEERRNNSNLPELITKIIHNRYSYNTYYFTVNYLSHFNPDFLFINGAGHRQHHVQGVGQLYWVQAPFLIYGLYLLVKKKDQSVKLIIPWLLLSYIPVSMTNDSIPNALRTLISVPTYQILTAYGLVHFYQKLKNKNWKLYTSLVILVVFVINLTIYLNNYFIKYPVKYSRDWQYGYKEVVSYIKDNQNEYDLVVFSRHYGEPHIFTLFYLGYDPKKFQESENLERFETYDWVRVLRFGKYYFPDLGDAGTKYGDIIKDNPGKKILFIGKDNDFPEDVKTLYQVKFLNGDPAFRIVESK